jgi:N-acetylglucosaminyldiphosphoundecaprenol N-acetyl-beta-D-mannosaminyltransferase
MLNRLNILDTWVDPITMEDALYMTSEYVEKGDKVHTIFASNPEKNYTVPKDPFLYDAFRDADLLVPDGIGMVLAAKILHGARLERVPGCELMQNICALSERQGYKIFIYGAREDVNAKAALTIKQRYPSIRIVGRSNGYVPHDKMDELIENINNSGAEILFVALGSPAQEKWISDYKKSLVNVRVCQGIGGTLDVIAGTVKRAPDIFCRLGIEWLYRLLAEPSRIRRQKILPIFAYRVLRQKIIMICS